MAKVTTKEMIALLNADIKFANLEIGDKEFVGYLPDEGKQRGYARLTR